MTCKECLHYCMCEGFVPTDLDKDVFHYCREGRQDEIPDVDERCSSFEDRTKFVEVVRCKDCKHYNERNEDCDHPVLWVEYCSDFGLDMKPDDFCSYGERKENERKDD